MIYRNQLQLDFIGSIKFVTSPILCGKTEEILKQIALKSAWLNS